MKETSSTGLTKIKNTKQALLDSLLNMAINEKIENITVSSLCKEAKINRATFYKYYSIPSDILLEHFSNLIRESVSFMPNEDQDSNSIYNQMKKNVALIYENRKSFKVYNDISGNVIPIITKGINEIIGNTSFLSIPKNTFIAGGVCAILMSWMRNDFKESPDDITLLLSQLIDKIEQ